MPFFPFRALLAGWGAWSLTETLVASVRQRWAPKVVLGLAVLSALRSRCASAATRSPSTTR